MTIDGLHTQIVAQRFGDEAGWKLRGYAIPFLFPQIGDWTWEQIADLRRDRNVARFRAVLREIELPNPPSGQGVVVVASLTVSRTTTSRSLVSSSGPAPAPDACRGTSG